MKNDKQIAFNELKAVVDHLPFRFLIPESVPEIFAMKVRNCSKSRRIFDVYCPAKF